MSRWSEEKTAQFVGCYKDHECLWNPKSFFYNSATARARAYEDLLDRFNDDKLTVPLLKAKIKNIRSTYHQELNKIQNSLKLGTALYKPTLRWFDALDSFLGETIQKDSTNPIPQKPKKVKPTKRKLVSSDPDFNASLLTNGKKLSARKQLRQRTNKSMTVHDDETNSEISVTPHRLDKPSTGLKKPTSSEDEFYFFGMNVAAQLRRLPLDTALRLQSEFQNTLYLARVRCQSSPVSPDREETIIQTAEDTESELTEQYVDDTEIPSESIVMPLESPGLPPDITETIEMPLQSPELPIDSPLSLDTEVHELSDNIFKRAWDAS